MSNQKPKSVEELIANTAPAAAVTPESLTAGVVGGDTSAIGQLLQLLLLKEGRELAKMNADAAAEAQRNERRAKNNKDKDSKVLLRQAKCRHLKGATSTAKNPTIDYAVAQHTFVNADTYIRCQICGCRWRPDDTAEYLVRGGRKIANHTKIGWEEAKKMQAQSTNTATMSEVPFSAIYEAQLSKRTTVNPNLITPVAPRVVDTDGNVAQNVEL